MFWNDALRIVLIHWPTAFQALNSALPPPSRMKHPSGMNVSPNTRLHAKGSKLTKQRNLAHSSNLHSILSRGITPGLQGVAQLICLFQETTRAAWVSSFRSRQRSFLPSKTQLHLGGALPLDCVRIVATSLADLSNQLPGHYRLEVDVEHQLDSILRTPRISLHSLAFLCLTSVDARKLSLMSGF